MRFRIQTRDLDCTSSKSKNCSTKTWILAITRAFLALQSFLLLRWSNSIGLRPSNNSVGIKPTISFSKQERDKQDDEVQDHGGKFAYSYIVGGCDQKSCLGYVLNAVVAAQVLQHYNSTADVLFLVRLASSQRNLTRLPSDQEAWLRRARVQVQYLTKVRHDDFGSATLEKFRGVELTDYDRVYFLDSDLIPLCNTDSHMQASYDGILDEYVGVQGGVAPISASQFIVTPKKGMFQQILDIVHRHRGRSQTFDIEVGWGHKIDEKDRWAGYTRSGTNWTMMGAQIDQGILYYWMKYQLLNWSQFILGGYVRTWREVTDIPFFLENMSTAVFAVPNGKYIANVKTDRPAISKCGKLYGRPRILNTVPYVDFCHYAGPGKPWLKGINVRRSPKELTDDLSVQEVWEYWLGVANQTFQLRLPSVIAISTSKNGSPFSFNKRDLNMLLRPDVEIPMPRWP